MLSVILTSKKDPIFNGIAIKNQAVDMRINAIPVAVEFGVDIHEKCRFEAAQKNEYR